MTSYIFTPFRTSLRWAAFGGALVGLVLGGISPRAGHAQPELVAEQFSDGVYNPDGLTVFSRGNPTALCFQSGKRLRLDGLELYCTDGSTLRQISNIGGTFHASPQEFAVYDDGSGAALYFQARDGTSGAELWRYDGSSVTQVADINPGSGSSRPADLTVYDGTLYFRADGGSDGAEFWRYDGSGVSQVADINSGSDRSRPAGFTVYDGALYFRADGGSDGVELWRYNGSTVEQAADINGGSGDSRPQNLVVYDDGGTSGADLYFDADGGSDGDEIWTYDGSTAQQVADINSGSSNSSPRAFEVYEGVLYFGARDGSSGWELWKYDGAVSLVEDINSSGGSDPRNLTVYDGRLYFTADDGNDGAELWQYDGTDASQAADIRPGSEGALPTDFAVYDGQLYFRADGGDGRKLWRYDSSTLVAEQPQFSNNLRSGPEEKIAFDGNLYFRADDGASGRELWKYDGFGVAQVADINDGAQGSRPAQFTPYDDGGGSGSDLYFAAEGGSDGRELWRYEGSSVSQVADIYSGADDSRPTSFTVYDDGSGPKLFFAAADGTNGKELFAYDGSGVSLIEDINSGSDWSRPRGLTVYDDGSGNKLYFSADNGSDGTELFVYDGNEATQVEDLNSGSEGSGPRYLTVYDGVLYFAADGGSNGRELWATNGSTFTRITDLNASGSSYPSFLTVYDDGSGPQLYFRARDGSSGSELWTYDGSAVNQVADINAGAGSSFPRSFAVYNNRLYFTATNGSEGREPYAYDGSSVQSVDVETGANSGLGIAPAVYDDGSGPKLYVTATDGTSGLELWRFDTNSAPLPVELTSFDGTQVGDAAVQLTWQTASEQDNAGFRVQHRSAETSSWTQAGFVESKAQDGTTTAATSYRFRLDDLAPGTHQFRLKQVDLDGATHSYEPIAVDLGMEQSLRLGAPAPNPIRQQATLSFAVKQSARTTLRLYDVLGQAVKTIYEGTPAGEQRQTVRFQVDGLSSGLYLLRLRTGEEEKTRRVTIVR